MSGEPAPGKLDNGWLRLAPDVLRYFFWATGGYKGVVLGEVVLRTWGVAWWTRAVPGGPAPDAEPCFLNISDLARASGLSQTRLNAAKLGLIADGLIVRHADGSLEPDKHYDRCRALDGQPALAAFIAGGATLMDETRSGRLAPRRRRPTAPCGGDGLAGKPANGAENPTERLVQEPANSGEELAGKPANPTERLVQKPANRDGGISRKTGYPLAGKPANDLVQKPANLTPPLNGKISLRGGEINSRPPAPARALAQEIPADTPVPPVPPLHVQTEDEEEALLPRLERLPPRPVPGRATTLRGIALEGRPTIPEQVESSVPVIGGDEDPDEAILELADHAIVHYYPNADNLRANIWRHRFAFPSAWFYRAVKRLATEGKEEIGWPLVRTILLSWHRGGGPRPGAEDAYTDSVPFDVRPASEVPKGAPLPAKAPPAWAAPVPSLPVHTAPEDSPFRSQDAAELRRKMIDDGLAKKGAGNGAHR